MEISGDEEKRKKTTKDPLEILTDKQWDELHEDLAKMSKQRKQAEDAAANIPMH